MAVSPNARVRLDASQVADETVARLDTSTGWRAAKRSLDILVSLAMLVCVSLPLLVIAIAIKLDSPGPVFYAHPRIGRYGRKIRVLKFRTMARDADQKLPSSWSCNPISGQLGMPPSSFSTIPGSRGPAGSCGGSVWMSSPSS